MKLQKQSSKKKGMKDYPKYVIVLPKKAVELSGFKEGDELEAEARKGEIKLRRKI
ncbi:MAG: hypothetical protein BWY36_00452 [Candidatus Diapherotrites archaeon ADurb.Bin253]|mgnify:CR=1 FL=1|jgi:bifunctional DNA-binding transcriptional regulator/antitoxin component of YhaV-PrlF toxin-antitoxin module|nr:AbrB/MazE/SpoVT family DNA-binding domain-containing protein [Candidatus Pacearchaeota archaeon]OQA68217.1 MAG: hypothetical protein BWY36_00452 [Candidatus Diapherotrites archaeon ADurb.Bin253]HQB18818.1 AbrB/MazE/SpoVT family DNA-binding domain-containing protein [Candidatus Pacearchaeota archaeon]